MTTFFDVISVTCFAGLVFAFFQLTDRDARTLVHFVLAGIVFGVANQVGNRGLTALAFILILAGVGYAIVVARR